MPFIDYNGATIALLLAFPNWDHEMIVELELPTTVEKAISALESRRVHASSPRYSLEYTANFVSADESQRYRLFLTRLKGELVAVPMWCDQVILASDCAIGATVLTKEDANPVRFGAEWILIDDEGSQFEIVTVDNLVGNTLTLHAGTTYAWPAGTFIYPLMFGRFSERPKPEWITDETITCGMKLKENSSYARRLAPSGGLIPTVGAGVPNFSTLPIWTIYPQFDKPKDSTEADVQYTSIGFLREEQQYVYQQGNRRTLELPFYQASPTEDSSLGRAEIAKVERFYVDRRGQDKSFCMPTMRNDMQLLSDLPAVGDSHLIPIAEYSKPGAFEDADRPVNPGDPYIALVEFDLTDLSQPPTIDPHKLSTIDGAGLHTVVAVTAPHLAAGTLISHLLLARFNDAKLTWKYRTDGKARTTIKFVELTNEYVDGPVAVPDPVFLYRFTHELATPHIYRFTSYENTVVIASGPYAGTYVPAPFSHGTLQDNTDLAGKMELESFRFTDNPLMLFLPFQLEGPLQLVTLEANAADLTAALVVHFAGEVWDVSSKGQELKASCLIFGRHLEKNFPNYNVQKVCNYAVYSPVPRCGVNKAAFAVTGNILSFTGVSPTEIHVAAGAAKAAEYFSIGFVETGVGDNFERRTIMHSEPLGGGAGTKIILNFPLLHAVVGQSLSMYPGCNGSKETCAGVFGNYSRFGAFPFVSDVNPTIKAMNAKNTGGGKK